MSDSRDPTAPAPPPATNGTVAAVPALRPLSLSLPLPPPLIVPSARGAVGSKNSSTSSSSCDLSVVAERLKPTVTIVRPNFVEVCPSRSEVASIRANHFEVNMDRWVDVLPATATIATSCRPLTLAQARALLACNVTKHTKHEVDASRVEHAAVLAELEQQLDALMASYDAKNNDVPTSLDTERLFAKALGSFTKQEQKEPGVRLQCLYRASLETLRVYSAAQALSLLLSSDRCGFDLNLDLKFPDSFSTALVVRAWTDIPLWTEFRAFVVKGTMTALSQYYTQLYFPEVVAHQDTLRDQILSFFESIKTKLPFESYSIDFAILKESCVVLELNAMNPSTGSCLFSWDADRQILERGPFEFRIVSNPEQTTQIREELVPSWQTIVFGPLPPPGSAAASADPPPSSPQQQQPAPAATTASSVVIEKK